MKGGGDDFEPLLKLTNKYIKYLFHHYNERDEWDVDDEGQRYDMVEQYMEDIELNKKNLKRFFGSTARDGEEIFTDKSNIYVSKIDELFKGFKNRYPDPGTAQLSDITLTEDKVKELYDSLDRGGIKKRGKKTPKLKRKKKGKKKGKTNNKINVSRNKKVRVRKKNLLTKRYRKGRK